MKTNLVILTLFLCAVAVAFGQNGSIYNNQGSIYPVAQNPASVSHISDLSARSVGDLITIVVNLSTTATKNQSTQTEKTTSVNDTITALLYPQVGENSNYDWYRFRDTAPQMNFSAAQSHEGSGQINNSETMVTTIQASIVEVLPNDVFRIQAKRKYETGEEKSELVLSGFVQRRDIDRNNSISSTRIHNLELVQKSEGDLSRSTRKGWLVKFYEMISPF